MSFQEHVEQRLAICCSRLQLSNPAKEILRILIMVDCKDKLAEDIQKNDPFARPGVLSWKTLAESVPSNSFAPIEEAVLQLADWGLIQVVGRSISDPVTPGPSAMRLTYPGRVCVGLSPAHVRHDQTHLTSTGWLILHGASLERLIEDVRTQFKGPLLNMPRSGDVELNRLCGDIAVQLCTFGHAVINAYGSADSLLMYELLRRTERAVGPRLLLLPEPTHVRSLAIEFGARLRWIEPNRHMRRELVVLDKSTSQSLLSDSTHQEADICGVPDSSIAEPIRCNTLWEDLIMDDKVQFQLEQALKHAQYRLHTLPQMPGFEGRKIGYRLLLSGLPGTGKSMTAEALATALDAPLVKLDLSSVLSKWLGETEKLIGQVFDVAEAAGAVLVLDEAEALLRQRNSQGGGGGGLSTGVAYMLTRFDRYTGVLVATTNRIEDLDEAFFRRFDDYAVIPIPDRETRTKMWHQMLFLDKHLDASVDTELLGKNFPISGGLIKGAAIRALAWATGLKKNLSTPFVLAALSRELEKNNMSTNQVLVSQYRDAVEALLDGDIKELELMS